MCGADFDHVTTLKLPFRIAAIGVVRSLCLAALWLGIACKKAHEQGGEIFPARLIWPKRIQPQGSK